MENIDFCLIKKTSGDSEHDGKVPKGKNQNIVAALTVLEEVKH